jgi:membrane protease YdiL (CAAX protease family)
VSSGWGDVSVVFCKYLLAVLWMSMKKSYWLPVLVFFMLAVTISGPFFYWRSVLNWEGFQGPNVLKTASYMWGPGIAGIVCHFIFRNRYRKEITIWGSSLTKSLIIWFVPMLLLAALGVRTNSGTIDHTTPAVLSVLAITSIWGEEFGWRWFLQDYLQPLKPLTKYIIIGVLWELWHLRVLSKLGQPITAIIFSSIVVMAVTVALAVVIGLVTDRTKSLFFACALHAWVDMCAEFPGLTTYICAGVTVMLCACFYFTWKQPEDAGLPLVRQ